MKYFVLVLLMAINLQAATLSADLRAQIKAAGLTELSEDQIVDIINTVALYNYRSPETLEENYREIFDIVAKCEQEPTPEAVAALSAEYVELEKLVLKNASFKRTKIAILRAAAVNTTFTFSSYNHIVDSALTYFYAIKRDVNTGNFEGCSRKLELLMTLIDPEVIAYYRQLAAQERQILAAQ